MRHASPGSLDQLEPLLAQLRDLPGLIEKTRGVFYLRSRAFLHFHEDPKGLFADLRDAAGKDFDRFAVNDGAIRAALLNLAAERIRGAQTKAPPDRSR